MTTEVEMETFGDEEIILVLDSNNDNTNVEKKLKALP